MLSILIPIYNFDVSPLVNTLVDQAKKTGIEYEIICLEDASTMFLQENKTILSLEKVVYERLNLNIGRSKIRNLLAHKASFDWLLFLDADVLPKSSSFISSYLPLMNSEVKVVNGGILYAEEKPNNDLILRWSYGKKREALSIEKRDKNPYLSLLTLNFLIHKSVFKEVEFNETIPNLRHEDTLFSFNLMQRKIPIANINNPIYHLGLDSFDKAIQKEKEAIHGLKFLLDHYLINPNYMRISNYFTTIKKVKLTSIGAFFYTTTHKIILKNLAGNLPNLVLFDCYRLSYLCWIEYNKKKLDSTKPLNRY